MHPKTFQVYLRQPFGAFTREPFIFHLHAESHRGALTWVGRVFEGIDVEPTLRAWDSPPRSEPAVGSTLPVSIIDNDAFSRKTRKGGKLVALPAEEGWARRSSDEVTQGLLRIFELLGGQHTILAASFEGLKSDYEKQEAAWQYMRLLEMKTYAEKALRWQANLWPVLKARREAAALEMPRWRSPLPQPQEAQA